MAPEGESVPDEIRLQKDMGLREAEFLAALPRVLTGFQWVEVEAGVIRAVQGDRELLLEYGPETVRCIAAVRLPRLPVTLAFRGFADAERDAFLAHFDRRFRRGGG